MTPSLLTYSQPDEYRGVHNAEQTLVYSQQPQCRSLRFIEANVEANNVLEMAVSSAHE
ncbi:hypothetical protein [Colwellia sp. PAMC 20917]|uniref:hypothetical protein n=1 Tax=Colwellia sp. PAMC 20917 TaxID=1816218 RepID=UPI0012F72FE1|nr:hypothetical protein [Colwellia sp. PAMC 20917]